MSNFLLNLFLDSDVFKAHMNFEVIFEIPKITKIISPFKGNFYDKIHILRETKMFYFFK